MQGEFWPNHKIRQEVCFDQNFASSKNSFETASTLKNSDVINCCRPAHPETHTSRRRLHYLTDILGSKGDSPKEPRRYIKCKVYLYRTKIHPVLCTQFLYGAHSGRVVIINAVSSGFSNKVSKFGAIRTLLGELWWLLKNKGRLFTWKKERKTIRK